MAAKLTTSRMIIVAVLVVLFGAVFFVVFNMDSFIEGFRKGRDAAYYGQMRSNCVSSAGASVKAQGVDPAAPETKQKIEGYCDCIVVEAQTKLPPSEGASLDLNSPEGNAKVMQLANACMGKLQ